MKVLIIGISGVTCGGKTTLMSELKEMFPNSRIILQDDYFLNVDDPRHVWCEGLQHINYDILTSLDMEKMHQDILMAIGKNELCKMKPKDKHNSSSNSPVDSLESIAEKLKEQKIHLILLDGFLLFNYKPFLPLITLKYFFTLSREECMIRREKRVYDPPDTPGYFEKCVWPEYLRHSEEVQKCNSDITYINGQYTNNYNIVLRDICDLL